MKIEVDFVKNRDLSVSQKLTINDAREANWGKGERKNFCVDFEAETIWIFIRDDKKIVSFGGLRPVKIKYLGKKYNILGICSTISIVGDKAYGRMMIAAMVSYFKKTGKSALGFTGKTGFFEKAGLGTRKDFIKRFVWVKKDGEKVFDDDGDGVFWNGKDDFLKKVLGTKSIVPIGIDFW